MGRFNMAPSPGELSRFRNHLHEEVDRAFRRIRSEQSFLSCFLLSAAVFLLVFFFLSIGIRDPIPVLDELLLSVGAAALTFILLRRRIHRSKESQERLSFALSRIDAIVFKKSEMLTLLVDILDDYYNLPLTDLQPLVRYKDSTHVFPPLSEELELFYKLLQQHFDSPDQKRVAKLQSKVWGRRLREKALRVDTPLYVLYRQLGFNYFEESNDT